MKTKSIVLSALAALALIGGTADNTAQAQSQVGYWTLYPQYINSSVTNPIDTGDKLFYLAMNRLHSYDKVNDESYSYNTGNKLNDNKIINMFYFPEIESLLLVYDTGNLDLLDIKTDKVVNMSDIADANINYNKDITNAYYHDGRIYVATIYGLVVFDANRHHVVDSGIYGTIVKGVATAGDYLYIIDNDRQIWAASPITERHNTLEKFTVTNYWAYPNQVVPFGNKGFVQHSYQKDVRVMTQLEGSINLNEVILNITPSQPLIPNADGTVTVITSSEIITLSLDAADNNYIASRKNIPSNLTGIKITTCDGGKTLWAFDTDGISNYTVADDGSLTVNIDKMQPNALVVDEIARMSGSSNGENLYMISYGIGLTNDYDQGNNASKPAYVGKLSNGRFYDITPYNEDGSVKLISPQAIAADPTKPDRVYVGTFTNGVAVIENGKLVTIFNKDNMPTIGWYGGGVLDLNFDSQNNLWVGCHNARTQGYGAYTMLTRDKLDSDLTKIKKEDWLQSADKNNFFGDWNMGSVISKKHDVLVAWKIWNGELHVINMNGNPKAVSGHKYIYLNTYTDQDGKDFKPSSYGWMCGVEDKEGNIWLGTDGSGIVRITKPKALGTAGSYIERVKVPRNDGTNYADYLLDSEKILSIAVDHSNRKWIGTKNSGVYLVSANGDKILEHFTTNNSVLPSNSVISIYCDQANNNVYFGTRLGLASYSSTSAPAADDYSDVYAYPNPVRPEYSGWITIKGLKENSLIKIADSSGNVFYEGRSQGGMAVWDGCTASGNRVPSGVYYVFASTSGEYENNEGAVTKIMIIR